VASATRPGNRGGAYKPRTSPYSFQGHGEKGLQWLAEAREITGLPIVTEFLDAQPADALAEHADVVRLSVKQAVYR